ncbi:hypothetical protein TNCV_5074451 [Trichonephila clavipes]|nr:hypothetical protein TNCV_5074451 [Trichonephila clavipes]
MRLTRLKPPSVNDVGCKEPHWLGFEATFIWNNFFSSLGKSCSEPLLWQQGRNRSKDLSGNKLHVLQKSDFPELRNIDTLLLTSSEVTLIKTEAFGNLMYLKQFCQVIYSQFGLAIHQNDHQARRRFVEWAQNEIAVVPDFHKRNLFSDEAHFWLNGYVNKQNCRIWSEANPQVYVETPLHPEKLTVWCALWAGGILLQKR